MLALEVFAVLCTYFTDLFVNALAADPCVIGIGSVIFIYFIYYFLRVPHKPEILVGRGCKFHRFLLKYCPVLKEDFTPTLWCYGSIAQTMLRPVVQRFMVPVIIYRRELLELPDGGILGLDHFGCESENMASPSNIVVMLSGLTGCSKAEYIRQFCINVSNNSCRAIVVNYRGMGGVELRTPRTYCSTHFEDLDYALKYIRKCNPDSKIMALGISLGGMILTHYLRSTEEKILCGAMAISPIWNAVEANKSLEEPVNWFIFNRYLVMLLRDMFETHKHLFENIGYDIHHVRQSKTIYEFDTRFTSKLFGFETNEAYYKAAAFDKKLHTIWIPTLYLNAADDVFCPRHTINDEFLYTSSNVACILTERGGHIGFMDGLFPKPQTYMNRLFIQYMNAIFQHGHEIVS